MLESLLAGTAKESTSITVTSSLVDPDSGVVVCCSLGPTAATATITLFNVQCRDDVMNSTT